MTTQEFFFSSKQSHKIIIYSEGAYLSTFVHQKQFAIEPITFDVRLSRILYTYNNKNIYYAVICAPFHICF